jgi:hypothetical protein
MFCNNPRKFNDLDRLLIALQADGCLFGCCPSGKNRRDFTFTFNKERKIQRLKEICNNLNIGVSIKTKNNQIVISGRLPDETPYVELIKDFSYLNLNEIDTDFAEKFIEEISQWDSHKTKNSIAYYNTNEKAIDIVQILALISNKSTNKAINRTKEQSLKVLNPNGKTKKKAKTCYILHINDVNKKTYPHRTEIPYNGMVYCVTVPSGIIVTRRNKRIAVCGNCRHSDAYSHLLEVLGMNGDFDILLQNPVIQGRVDYLTKYLKNQSDNSNENYTLSLALFSLFIENISLFSQFAVIKSFFKFRTCLKDIDNVVQATQKEELIHAMFGIYLINIIKEQNPEWFNEEFYTKLYKASNKAYEAEAKIIDWIFEQGDLDFISPDLLKEFIKDRFNQSLNQIGGKSIFEVDIDKLKQIQWFNDEIYADTSFDFFHKRPVTYAKKTKAIQAGDLF